jgi:hypothetical protein
MENNSIKKRKIDTYKTTEIFINEIIRLNTMVEVLTEIINEKGTPVSELLEKFSEHYEKEKTRVIDKIKQEGAITKE